MAIAVGIVMTLRILNRTSAILAVTTSTFFGACAVEVDSGGASPADDNVGTISAGSTALPTFKQLQPLNIDESDVGALTFSSNNPETVTKLGILASTYSGIDAQRGDTYSYSYTSSAPAATIEGSNQFDSSCPDGSVRSISVYIAHIMATKQYVGLGVWSVDDASIEVSGDLGFGPWDTRNPSFVSAKVIKDYYFNNDSTKRTVAAGAGVYTQIDSAGGSGGYIDGRLSLSSSSCFYVFTVAQSSAKIDTLPEEFAQGNIAWPGWYGGQGAGRNAGVYNGDRRVGSQDFSLPGPDYMRGYRVATIEQSAQAVFRLKDSAEVSFGNYGSLYDQSFNVTNSGKDCMIVQAELVSYAAVKADDSPTYSVYNSLANDQLPSVFWNGPVLTMSTGQPTLDHVVLYAEKNHSTPTATVPTVRKVLETVRVEVGATGALRYQIPVPGLISAPAAMVFTSEKCD
jgi:hypothetical protein